MISTIIGIAVIFSTLMPKNMVLPGTMPDYLLIDHFSNISEAKKQIREYKIQTIINIGKGCDTNNKKIDAIISRFKISIWIVGTSVLITILYFSFIWTS
jgi:hypothetical protein